MTHATRLACFVFIALAAGASAVLADISDIPNRKPGLWEMKMMLPGGKLPPQTIQQCTDETTDKDMRTSFGPMAKDMCSKQDVQKTATGMTIDSVCNVNGSVTTSHIDINGDFNSAYTMQISSSHEGGAPNMPKQTHMTIDAKWLGDCKSDQRAGDTIMPGGIKMNIKDMQALRSLIPVAPK